MDIQEFFSEYLPREAAPSGPKIDEKMLRRLRRQQLRDIAYAFDIPASDGAKPALLMACVGAIGTGVFNRPPKRPEYLAKAMRNSDDLKAGQRVDWESYAAPVISKDDFQGLRMLAKRHGINSFGMGKDALWEALQKAGAV